MSVTAAQVGHAHFRARQEASVVTLEEHGSFRAAGLNSEKGFSRFGMLYTNEVNPGESLFSHTLGQRHRYHTSLITRSRLLAAVL